MKHLLGLVYALSLKELAAAAPDAQSIVRGFGPSAYTAAGVFPASAYTYYYNDPTATSAQPQPIITDPVTVSACLCFTVPISH